MTPPSPDDLPLAWLIALTLVPFLLVVASAFVKSAVVLSIVRSAFGSSDLPPTLVVTALAAMLSIVVMSPVASEMIAASEAASEVHESAAHEGQEPGARERKTK